MIATQFRVRDLMTDHIIKVTPNHSFTELCRLLFQLSIHHLPVVDKQEKLIGIISSNDILQTYGSKVAGYRKIDEQWLNENITIYDLMSPDPVVVSPDASVEEAIQLFKEKHIQSLPVLEDDRLVGIITTRDVIEFLVD
jgi:acetoin utilization protein AcuB